MGVLHGLQTSAFLVRAIGIVLTICRQSHASGAHLIPIVHRPKSRLWLLQWSKFSLERIQSEFPALVAEARKAQMEFDLTFKSSYESIERELRKLFGEKWNEYTNRLRDQITQTLTSTAISKEQAAAFVKEATGRAKGPMESPVLETFLTYNPNFRKIPQKSSSMDSLGATERRSH